MEIWKDVVGFPGYQVSSDGRVKSFKRSREKILKPGPTTSYLSVVLMRDNKTNPRLVHRLVLEAFVGPAPSGMECRHKDGDGRNNTLDNLEWATHMDNMQDKVAHGTLNRNRARGEGHKSAVLTACQVEQIRVEYAAGQTTQKQLADKYNTSRSNIGLIVTYKNWKKVD